MKKALLLVSLVLAGVALAGCSHPSDLIDDTACAAPAARAAFA